MFWPHLNSEAGPRCFGIDPELKVESGRPAFLGRTLDELAPLCITWDHLTLSAAMATNQSDVNISCVGVGVGS